MSRGSPCGGIFVHGRKKGLVDAQLMLPTVASQMIRRRVLTCCGYGIPERELVVYQKEEGGLVAQVQLLMP